MQSMLGRVLFTLVNAGTGMITARALHPAGRGELSALGVWPNFLGGLMTFGVPSALIYWTRTQPEKRQGIIWASLPITVVCGCLAILIGVVGMPTWLAQYNAHIVFAAQLFMLNAVFVLGTANARALCEAEGNFLASSVALCITPIITVAVLVGLVSAHRLTPVSAAGAYVISGIPACLYLVHQLRHCFVWPPQEVHQASRQLLTYGIRSYGVDICGTLSLYADQAIVVHSLAPEAMGTYVVALSLSRTLGVIHQTVATVLFPKAVAKEVDVLVSMTGRAVRISTLLTVFCGAFVGLFGPHLLSLLYGQEYRTATGILDVLIAEAVLTGMALVLTRAYMAIGRPGVVTALQSSGLVLSIPLLMVLIPRWGVMGASIALLIAAFIRLILSLWSFRPMLGVSAPRVFPRWAESRAFTQTILVSGITFLRRRSIPTEAA